MPETLTKDQLKFLDECDLEFSNRFTDADVEYKKIYDLGIPPPPIMCPWYGRAKFNNNRDGAGGSRFNEHRDRDRDYNRDGDRNHRGNDDRFENRYRDRNSGYREHNNRFRPY